MAQRQAIEASEAGERPGSGFRVRAQTRYALREGAVEHRVDKSPLVLGRGSGADVVLAGALVSRRHAEFHETEAGLVVIDLSSRNGVLLNDAPLTSPAALLIGDKLSIGNSDFVVIEVQGMSATDAVGLETRTIRDSSRVPAGTHDNEEVPVATRRAEALHLLSSVADEALTLGRGQEAEHVLGRPLVAVLSDAVARRTVAPELARTSAQYAIKLATVTGKAAWLDFAFRLYSALGETIPLPLVDEMYTVLRRVRGIDRELLRHYTDLLHARAQKLSAPERFVVQRLEGLERLAGSQPAS